MGKDDVKRGGGGRTQALDLDDLELGKRRNSEDTSDPEAWVKSNKGWDDPWSTGPKQRSWAQDERWTGDDGSHRVFGSDGGSSTMALDLNELKPRAGDDALVDDSNAEMWGVSNVPQREPDAPRNAPRGWSAPKRDEMVASGGGWDDWNEGGGGGQSTMALSMESIEEEAKETGARRKRQAAASYQADSSSVYGDGQARRREIYRSKEDAEAEGRGLQAYGGGRREVYGAQQGFDNDDWSSSPDAGRRPPAPPSQQVLPPSERTVALDLDGSSFDGGGGGFGGPPQTLSPNERTFALDGYDPALGGFAGQPNAQQQAAPGSLVIFSPDNAPVPYELGAGVTSVGRGLDNDVVLSDPFASRKHFLIVHREGQFELRDAGTDNGTCINGHRVTQALLRHGDHIELGNTVLRFVAGTPGPAEMMFGPPPPIPPHHLAAPPGGMMPMPGMPGSMAHPIPGMMPPGMHAGAPPKKSKAGLVIGLLLALFLVVGGGGAAVWYFVLRGSSSSSDSSSSASGAESGSKDSTQLGVDDTGYKAAAGPSKKEKAMREAIEAHDNPNEEVESANGGGSAAAPAATDTAAADSGSAAGTPTTTASDTPPAATAGPAADPVLVAGLVGSSAMATGQARPLKMTLAGEPVEIRIDTEPTNAEIYDAQNNLIGRSPYHITQIKAPIKTKWSIRKAGFDSQVVEIDFDGGTTASLTLSKEKGRAASSSSSSRRRRDDDRPKTTAIPTVD